MVSANDMDNVGYSYFGVSLLLFDFYDLKLFVWRREFLSLLQLCFYTSIPHWKHIYLTRTIYFFYKKRKYIYVLKIGTLKLSAMNPFMHFIFMLQPSSPFLLDTLTKYVFHYLSVDITFFKKSIRVLNLPYIH